MAVVHLLLSVLLAATPLGRLSLPTRRAASSASASARPPDVNNSAPDPPPESLVEHSLRQLRASTLPVSEGTRILADQGVASRGSGAGLGAAATGRALKVAKVLRAGKKWGGKDVTKVTRPQLTDDMVPNRIPPSSDNWLAGLYRKYAAEVNEMWAFMHKNFCGHPECVSKTEGPTSKQQCTGFGTLESELLYMRVREARPQHILEVAPQVGYSSFLMLFALEKNGDSGKVHSFDVDDVSQRVALPHLPQRMRSQWKFTAGDARQTLPRYPVKKFDFIFIDALHTEQFAAWYTNYVFPNLAGGSRTYFYVHDIFCLPHCMRYGNPELKPCLSNYLSLETQYQCTKRAGWNPSLAFREGVPLLAYYATTPGASHGLTISYFRSPSLVNATLAERARLGVRGMPRSVFQDSPGFYFEIDNRARLSE